MLAREAHHHAVARPELERAADAAIIVERVAVMLGVGNRRHLLDNFRRQRSVESSPFSAADRDAFEREVACELRHQWLADDRNRAHRQAAYRAVDGVLAELHP